MFGFPGLLSVMRVNGEILEELGSALTGSLITLDLDVFDGALHSSDGHLRHPSGDERYRGRHSFTVSGLTAHPQKLVVHSTWGPDWGNSGRGCIDADYCSSHLAEASLFRHGHAGPSPEQVKVMRGPSVSSRQKVPENLRPRRLFAKLTSTPNPLHVVPFRVGGMDLGLGRWQVLSAQGGHTVDVLELRLGSRGIARCHVHHQPAFHLPERSLNLARPLVSTIEEIFVHPDFRRRKLGTSLYRLSEKLAGARGSREVCASLFEADAVDGDEGARRFAASLDLTWLDLEPRRPIPRVALATRELASQ
ncbi:MAG: GNAT family N-acetyltransferase [Patulibacter sp.]|nr:GNAT family N-acetyltransferase [Patulibacter sp.]